MRVVDIEQDAKGGLPTCLTNSSAVSELVSNVPGWSTLSFNGSSAMTTPSSAAMEAAARRASVTASSCSAVGRAADQALARSRNQYRAAQIRSDLGRVLHVGQPFLVRAPVRNGLRAK